MIGIMGFAYLVFPDFFFGVSGVDTDLHMKENN